MKNILKIISILSLIITNSCAQKKAEQEKWFIPIEHRGKVLVIYDVKEGKPKEYDNDTRVYKINSNGILITKFNLNEGHHQSVSKEVKFYLFNDNDTIQLPVIYTALNLNKEPNDNKIHIFEIHNGSFNSHAYTSFFVDTLYKGKNYPDKAFTDDSIDSVFKQNNIK